MADVRAVERAVLIPSPELGTPAQSPREGEERIRSIVDNVIDGIITIDDAGLIETFNPAAERLFGYTAEEVVGRNVRMLMPEPYHSEHDGYIGNYLTTGVAKIIGIGREVVGRRKDGTVFPMDLAVGEFHLKGRRYFTGIVRDVTERKQAELELRNREERIRSIVNHVIDGIITIDNRGGIESFNPAAEKIFGYLAEEVQGKNVKLLMPEPFYSEHDGYLTNYLRTGEAKIIGIGREVVGRRKDGSTFPMDLAVSAFRLGEQLYFTGIVRDITERKRLEQELHQRVEELAEADRRKDEFLAMLAHELRNPLAPLRNSLQILKIPGIEAAMVREAQEMMERQIEHMIRLVDDLLDVARIMRGKIELRPERIELASVVAQAVETARPTIDARGHRLEISVPSEPIFFQADRVRLSQVIANLLNNAAKYTPRAGHIWLSASIEDNELVFRVRDTGIGLDPALLGRIFEPFVQGEKGRDRTHGGLGIGLTLVKSLVELHGGRVEAHSAGEGKGSEFVVRLIVNRAPVTHASSGAPSPGATRQVLVVDDNVDAARSLAMMLKLHGHRVDICHDGPTALIKANEVQPEVVFLDIGMPVMNGYEVARRLRGNDKFGRALLVAVTGWGTDEDRRMSQEAGFDAHMVKPVDLDGLMRLFEHPRLAGV